MSWKSVPSDDITFEAWQVTSRRSQRLVIYMVVVIAYHGMYSIGYILSDITKSVYSILYSIFPRHFFGFIFQCHGKCHLVTAGFISALHASSNIAVKASCRRSCSKVRRLPSWSHFGIGIGMAYHSTWMDPAKLYARHTSQFLVKTKTYISFTSPKETEVTHPQKKIHRASFRVKFIGAMWGFRVLCPCHLLRLNPTTSGRFFTWCAWSTNMAVKDHQKKT